MARKLLLLSSLFISSLSYAMQDSSLISAEQDKELNNMLIEVRAMKVRAKDMSRKFGVSFDQDKKVKKNEVVEEKPLGKLGQLNANAKNFGNKAGNLRMSMENKPAIHVDNYQENKQVTKNELERIEIEAQNVKDMANDFRIYVAKYSKNEAVKLELLRAGAKIFEVTQNLLDLIQKEEHVVEYNDFQVDRNKQQIKNEHSVKIKNNYPAFFNGKILAVGGAAAALFCFLCYKLVR